MCYWLRPRPCREGFPRLFSTSLRARHENPLGLPCKGQQGTPQIPRRGTPLTKRPIPNVKKVLAVASGKGGVGKSTIAGALLLHLHLFFPMTIFAWITVNLAFSLSHLQNPSTSGRLRVGILDLDIFGPSVPTLMGLQDCSEPELTSSAHIFSISTSPASS